jgi:hypothetical protein
MTKPYHKNGPAVIRFKAEAPTFTGHQLARRLAHATPAQKAAWAVSLHLGEVKVTRDTLKQRVRQCDANLPYAYKAQHLTAAERRQVRDGVRPLVAKIEQQPEQPPEQQLPLPLPASVVDVAELFVASSPAERVDIIRRIGVATVWDSVAAVLD